MQSKQPSDPNCSRSNSRCPPTKPQSPARTTRIAVSSVALSDSGEMATRYPEIWPTVAAGAADIDLVGWGFRLARPKDKARAQFRGE